MTRARAEWLMVGSGEACGARAGEWGREGGRNDQACVAVLMYRDRSYPALIKEGVAANQEGGLKRPPTKSRFKPPLLDYVSRAIGRTRSRSELQSRPQVPSPILTISSQAHVTRTLKNAVEQNRLAHAYLFVGPRGIGKTSTARILAKALNCVNGPTVSPCGVCDSCKEIAAGNSLDVLEIDGASNNGVEQVRGLRDNVRYARAKAFKLTSTKCTAPSMRSTRA